MYENFGGNAWGETDIKIEFSDGATLLIENKLSADFQKEQAERYRARADHYKRAGLQAQTVLIAPEIYLRGVSSDEWDKFCSYAQISDCIRAQDPRSIWRKSLLLTAASRAARVRNLAESSSARRAASGELLRFKNSWWNFINNGADWRANPQTGSADEFLYAPRINPFGLRIWHHPLSGYFSIQNLEKFQGVDGILNQEILPDGFRIMRHPRSIYLDATTPEIDMSADFADEFERVDAGMKVARHALDIAEAAIRQLPSSS